MEPIDEAQIRPEELKSPSKSGFKEKRRKPKIQRVEQDPSLLRDVLGWIAILMSIAWLLLLISYDPSDPSQFSASNRLRPANYLGKVGANIAAHCFQYFGFGSYIFPLASIYLGFLCIRVRRVNDWFFQIAGGGTVIFAFLIFLGGFEAVGFKEGNVMPGGYVGTRLWSYFAGHLNPVGTYLFLIGSAVLALLVSTRLTLKQIGRGLLVAANWVGGYLMRLAKWVSGHMEDQREKKAQQRIIERELDKMEVQKKKRWGRSEDKQPLVDPEEPGGQALIHMPLEASNNPTIEVTTEQLGMPDELPEPTADLSPAKNSAPVEDQIVVNKMKTPLPVTQDAFQFVKDMEENWVYPTSFHFNKPNQDQKIDEEELRLKARAVKEKFEEFKVTGEMREIHPGPVVTTYEFRPDAGIKYSKIVNLTDDLCLALGAESIRIDRMPGRYSIGIEVPNNKRELITFREMIETESFRNRKAKLMLSLGKTIDGTPFYADLAKMPHLLIAGQTGSGKSVGINAMLCSILMRSRPDETKLILIDPKMVELGMYGDIPHLLTPVVTDPLEAANALKWAVDEMERRYRLLASYQFRNLDHYNKSVKGGSVEAREGEDPLTFLPHVVVVIDEMADLMMVARGEVEESVARLAQKSRAIGIHLILATQRPSVDIITGVIKSNLPSRLAYRVAQRNDSRIILDTNGADRLLGKGDALFLGPGTSRLVRVHAPYLSEAEVLDLVKFLKNQGKPVYNREVLKAAEGEAGVAGAVAGGDGSHSGGKPKKSAKDDPMYDKAARLVVRSGQASVSYLQRKLSLGYARAAKLVDMMEADGIVGPSMGSKARDILVASDYFDEVDNRLL